MVEKRRFNGSNRCEMRCTLTSDTPIHTEILALLVRMPIAAMTAAPPVIRGRKFAFGPVRDIAPGGGRRTCNSSGMVICYRCGIIQGG